MKPRARPRDGGSAFADLAAAVRLAREARPAALLGMVLTDVGVGLTPVGLAWLMKTLLDDLTRPQAPGARLLPVVVGLFVLGVGAAVLPRLSTYAQAQLDRAVALIARERLFISLDRLSGLAKFEDPAFLDQVRLAQQSGVSAPSKVVAAGLGVVTGLLTVIGFFGSLLVVNPWMAALVLLGAIPVVGGQFLLAGRRAAMMLAIMGIERREWFFSFLLSDLAAAKELRLFRAGGYLREQMLNGRRAADGQRLAMDRREVLTQGGLSLLSAVIAGGGLLWAVLAVHQGRLTIGDVSIFVAAIGGVQAAVMLATAAVALARQDLLMFGHYQAVLHVTDDLQPPAAPRPLPPLRHGIELRDVWFRYAPDLPWTLAGVDLFIPQGQAVALVGRNGAGKSTLVKLLCRFYDPERGAILWDGVDLRDVEVTELRARMGAVFQDFMQYDLTAATNIGLGDVDCLADRDRIRAAAVEAGIHGTLAGLPRGLDTPLTRMFVSEEDKADAGTGVVLSQGQWQRLALARALFRGRRDLLILDEPSSGLDAEAEAELHQRLRTHRHGGTSLLISHRMGAVRQADVIVGLADGVIVERGTHEELLTAGGVYAQLFQLQAEGYQAEGYQPELTIPGSVTR